MGRREPLLRLLVRILVQGLVQLCLVRVQLPMRLETVELRRRGPPLLRPLPPTQEKLPNPSSHSEVRQHPLHQHLPMEPRHRSQRLNLVIRRRPRRPQLHRPHSPLDNQYLAVCLQAPHLLLLDLAPLHLQVVQPGALIRLASNNSNQIRIKRILYLLHFLVGMYIVVL